MTHLTIAIFIDDNTGAATWSAVECNVAIICASLPSTRAFLSRLLPHIFSTGSNGYHSKTTRPSRGDRNALTGTHSNVHASVIGGRESNPDYDLEDLSPSGSSQCYTKAHESKGSLAGIKVTTFVTQESTSNTAVVNDETGSTKGLVHNHNF